MADLFTRRIATWAPRVAVVLAVVVAVFVLSNGDDRPDDAAPPSDPTSTPTAEPTRASPEEFCTAFRAFATAADLYVATQAPADGEAMRAAGLALVGLNDPFGLTPGAEVSLDMLVAGSLVAVGETVPVRDDVEADPTAFDLYLSDVCPA